MKEEPILKTLRLKVQVYNRVDQSFRWIHVQVRRYTDPILRLYRQFVQAACFLYFSYQQQGHDHRYKAQQLRLEQMRHFTLRELRRQVPEIRANFDFRKTSKGSLSICVQS